MKKNLNNFRKNNLFKAIQCTFILLLVTTMNIYAQQGITITGTVSDSNDPLPGVNVTIKGTTTGATTNANGVFSISVPNKQAVLVFSYIGYSTQEIQVGDKNVINVTLIESTQQIDEVVVVGYGTVRKSDLTGAVLSISNEKFKNLPFGGATQILQGRAAGVNITSTSGAGNTNIRIRGTTSINKSSEPLWVVDGVIGGAQGNFYDIESIEVLKDASSTAIYGSQGANGVILVTTKKAKEGKARVLFDTRFGWNTLRKAPDLMNAYEFAEAYRYVKGNNAIKDDEFNAYKNGTKGIDWIDTMTQTGFTQSYNLNVSGGSAKTKYAISTSVGDTKSQIITITDKSINIKASLDTEIAPWLNFSGYVYGSRSKSHNGANQDEFATMLEYTPCMNMMEDNGYVYKKDPYSSLGENPYAVKMAKPRDYWRNSLSAFGDLKIKLPVDGLTLSIQGLYRTNTNIDRGIDYTYREPNSSNYAYHLWSEGMNWRVINNLTYQKEFGDHRLTATAVQELYKATSSNVRAETRNFEKEVTLGYWALGTGSQTTNQDWSNSAVVSYIGRLVYSYKGKYSLTGTFRADACSQFVDKYKWGYFPSLGLSWNIAEEDFFNKDLIQQLKLRASAGTVGNHGVGAYSTLALMTKESRAAYGTTTQYPGFWPRELNNKELRWEKTTSYNIGVDVSLLNQRLGITADAYIKDINDLLFRQTLPAYNGKGTIWTNKGNITNKGFELTVNAWPVRSNDFIWESNFTASYNKNEVKDLAGVDFVIVDSSRGGANSGGLFALQVGKPVGTYYIQEFAGFDDEGRTLHIVQKGDDKGKTTFRNQNDNKIILDKPSIPRWNFGWNNSLTYKNWDFNIFFRGTGEYYRLNQARFYESCMIGAKRFISSREAYEYAWDRVSDKSKAKFASLTNSSNQYVPGSTQWLENAMFLRCQNITLGYQIPKSVAKFADIHLSLSVQNLFVLTNYTGLDPEVVSEYDTNGNTGTFDTTFGLDTGAFPIPRSYSVIARFNF